MALLNINNISKIPQTIRNIQRFRQIISVIGKHGFEDLVIRLNLEARFEWAQKLIARKMAGQQNQKDPATPPYRIEERIRMVCEELGPTFIKLGQILATRPDLIPMSLVNELRKLQDRVPAFSSNEAFALIEEELGQKIEMVFADLDKHALAAASIAQVHKGTLKSGEKIVVKVQRPHLEKIISTDLDILKILASLLEENIPEMKQYDPCGIVNEFSKSIIKEIDFTKEAQNIERFAKNFAGNSFVHCLKVYNEYSSSKILTLEFIDGVKAYDLEGIKKLGCDNKTLAMRGTEVALKQIFIDGFFHADPHPGNIFILPNNVLCLIDYGMMGTVDEDRIEELLHFLVAVLTSDLDKLISLFYRLELIDDTVNVRLLKAEMGSLLQTYYNMPLKEIDVGIFITEVFEVIQTHRVKVPSDLLLMAKAIVTIEGIAKQIYPEFDPLEDMKNQILKIYLRKLADPTFLLRKISRNIDETFYLLKRLPKDVNSIMSKLQKGTLTIQMQDPDRKQELAARQKQSDRLVLAILLLSLNIGSPLLMYVGARTFGHAFSIFAMILGVFSGVFTLSILIGRWRQL
jgi:ubiquinone biosynthesis protein